MSTSDVTEQKGVPRDESATLADRVFEQLRRAIVEGEIPAGSKLSEPELATRFGISRGPLREALRRLESTNLVERRPNLGARVITLSNDQLLEIYVVREALEGMAARLAAEHMSGEAIGELRDLIEQHRRDLARDSWQSYFQMEGEMDLHYRVVQGSGNRRLIGILCDDLYHLARMYRCQLGTGSDRAREALKEHALIVEAIGERDGELAELLMRRHIRASRRGVERRLAEKPGHLIQGIHP
ncbi:MAG: GntR family transcriptional regulator [Bdellovibrio bacteriovorus]